MLGWSLYLACMARRACHRAAASTPPSVPTAHLERTAPLAVLGSPLLMPRGRSVPSRARRRLRPCLGLIVAAHPPLMEPPADCAPPSAPLPCLLQLRPWERVHVTPLGEVPVVPPSGKTDRAAVLLGPNVESSNEVVVKDAFPMNHTNVEYVNAHTNLPFYGPARQCRLHPGAEYNKRIAKAHPDYAKLWELSGGKMRLKDPNTRTFSLSCDPHSW